MIDKSIVVGILARDCAKALKENIQRMETLGNYFSSYHIVACENDSKDGTKEILKEWAARNGNVVITCSDTGSVTIPKQSEAIPFPGWSAFRIEKMAAFRNRLLDEIGARFEPDLVCLLDADLLYFSPEGVVRAIENAPEGWGGLFANGRQWCTVNGKKRFFPTQYDPYAFLVKGRDYKDAASYRFNHEDDIFKGYWMHRLVTETDAPFVPCESAFGGLGIYKYECIKDARYQACVLPEYENLSISLCEHVPFNCEISRKGYGNYIAKDILTIREHWDEKTTKGLAGLFKHIIKEKENDVSVKSLPAKKRYTVLSYIFNGYEKIHEVGHKDPQANYVLVTDDFLLSSDTWNTVYDPALENMSPFDKTFYVRYHCFRYCDTDLCLRVDGSICIKNSLKPLVDIFEQGNYDACLMPHPLRDNFPEEYDFWIKTRGYPKEQAQRCLDDMKEQGYDFNYRGMFQACFSIQRRGPITDEIDSVTYDYLKRIGADGDIERLDQIPFSFIMNTRFSHLKVLPVSEQILRSHYMQWYEHNSPYMNLVEHYNREEPDSKYMFNRKVECLYLETPPDYYNQREAELIKYAESLTEKCRAYDWREERKERRRFWRRLRKVNS